MDSQKKFESNFFQIEKILNDLFNQSEDISLSSNTLYSEISQHGFQLNDVKNVITTLVRRGVLFEPEKGHLRRINLNPSEKRRKHDQKNVFAE